MIVYAITDPSIFSFDALGSDLDRISSIADMILYRDKNSPVYRSNAFIFVEYARGRFDRVMLHGDIDLVLKTGADGIHLTSRQFDEITRAKKLNLFVVVSTHNFREAKQAEEMGADMVTLSPVFHSPGKGEPIGIPKLKQIISDVTIPVLALGGILTNKHIELCKEAGATGFASIRYFK